MMMESAINENGILINEDKICGEYGSIQYVVAMMATVDWHTTKIRAAQYGLGLG